MAVSPVESLTSGGVDCHTSPPPSTSVRVIVVGYYDLTSNELLNWAPATRRAATGPVNEQTPNGALCGGIAFGPTWQPWPGKGGGATVGSSHTGVVLGLPRTAQPGHTGTGGPCHTMISDG